MFQLWPILVFVLGLFHHLTRELHQEPQVLHVEHPHLFPGDIDLVLHFVHLDHSASGLGTPRAEFYLPRK